MLNQPAKKSKKADAPAVLRHLAVQKLNHAKSGLCSSPSKLPDDALNRENKLHPLASTFNGEFCSQRYLEEVQLAQP